MFGTITPKNLPIKFFQYLKGRCHGNQFCGKITYQTLHLWLCHSDMEWDIATSMCASTAQVMPLYRVKKIRELWFSTSRENGAHLWTICTTWQKTSVFSRISWDILDRFLRSFHRMKALFRADNRSVPRFPICQGTLPWQSIDFGEISWTTTDTTCILCTISRKRVAISLSICVH